MSPDHATMINVVVRVSLKIVGFDNNSIFRINSKLGLCRPIICCHERILSPGDVKNFEFLEK